ncbi:MAG: DNA mismatch repair endonuclease MutL, partial [Paracoccaceae bacterium]|nr:DNA mismatch repair endonuclease MutL [Paracoccaceae bacterium]
MSAPTHNIDPSAHIPGRIRRLSAAAANRIAAGEVIERPAAAVKELVENAIDAGASRVDIAIAEGGKTLIRVSDDGFGMVADELPLALERHATSKIDGSDLLNIRTFGFRGEALPSMAAVSRMRVTSRADGADEAWMIEARGGDIDAPKPAARRAGTEVELRDLFYATPARLKFLKTDRAETQAISETLKRLAMAAPNVAFTLSDQTDGKPRELFRADAEQGDLFDARLARLRRILGTGFAENALPVDAEREGLRLTGWAALPTYSRGSATQQFLFVNGRPVRDKMMVGALRGAYADFLSR